LATADKLASSLRSGSSTPPRHHSIAQNIQLDMTKIFTWLLVAILIVGAIASWGFIPKSWFDKVPTFCQIILIASAIIFSAVMILGYVLDSEILQKIFKKKSP
jgi:SNF family Na+-dependent transporter